MAIKFIFKFSFAEHTSATHDFFNANNENYSHRLSLILSSSSSHALNSQANYNNNNNNKQAI